MMQSNILFQQQIVENALEAGLAGEIERNCPAVERKKKISVEDFHRDHVARNSPVILTGLAEHWPARKKWTLDFFAESCGDTQIYTNLYDPALTNKHTFSSFIAAIKSSQKDKPVYLQEWWYQPNCPFLAEDFDILPHFADDWSKKILGFYNSTLWIGSKYAKTPIHQDTTHSNIWTVQVMGKKQWLLFDKQAHLHPDVNGKPDFDRFLSDPATGATHCMLEAGDLLYVPWKWWHRASTLEHSISVNTFYITEEIIARYMRDVLSILMLVSLHKDELLAQNPMRYNICMTRIKLLANLMKFDPSYLLKVNQKSDIPSDAAAKTKLIA